MSASDSWKLLIFREGRVLRPIRELLCGLQHSVQSTRAFADFTSQAAREAVLEALLRAGELECALADSGQCDPAHVDSVAALADRLAVALLSRRSPQIPADLLESLRDENLPATVSVSRPEGFCYYALHPLDYADLLSELQLRPPAAAVIGIRSIGTTLSAVVRAWFEHQGIPAERISVRPNGHPFDRRLNFDFLQNGWIASQQQKRARFFVVDEGPGLSGSSFLAVGEALLGRGIPREDIIFLPSSEPDLQGLLAPNAAERWSQFRTFAAKPTRYIPEAATQDISCGRWRDEVFQCHEDWPAVWSWTERKKYLSADQRRLFRFDGLAHYGNVVRRRSQLLAEHGWGPAAEPAGNGFTVFPWLCEPQPPSAQWSVGRPGRLLRTNESPERGRRSIDTLGKIADLQFNDPKAILQLAQYCAFRAQNFKTEVSEQSALEHMAVINLERALGVGVPPDFHLTVQHPVVPDARLLPHEWIAAANGRLLKCDASSHGDDHFFPGPTDIAWDLAGVIVEWNLDREQIRAFLDEYRRISNDNAEPRLGHYLIAYCAFRLGFSLSAAQSIHEAAEKQRFEKDAQRYRERILSLLCLSTAA